MNKGTIRRASGFTILELLIVIVVIAILAAISLVAYNGIQDRSRTSKINSDLAALERAIVTARASVGDQVLQTVTTSYSTAGSCMALADGTDLSANNPTTSSCWTSYTNALNAISTASGANVRGLKDPWGRPYFIDENEKEGGSACGGKDGIAVFANPHVNGVNGGPGWSLTTNRRNIPYVTPGC